MFKNSFCCKKILVKDLDDDMSILYRLNINLQEGYQE